MNRWMQSCERSRRRLGLAVFLLALPLSLRAAPVDAPLQPGNVRQSAPPPTRGTDESAIRETVKRHVTRFADSFLARHTREADDPDGTINRKIFNPFLAVLGEDMLYYTALARSFDSALGCMIEDLAIDLARQRFQVSQEVSGPLHRSQIDQIARLLDSYLTRSRQPSHDDYTLLRASPSDEAPISRRHASDYHLYDPATDTHYLLELKIGGDLDIKKARAEKSALMEQYAILSNAIGADGKILCFMATAYNRLGEDADWENTRVLRYFSRAEMLVGREFWDFITGRDDGGAIVVDAYRDYAGVIRQALDRLRALYLDRDRTSDPSDTP